MPTIYDASEIVDKTLYVKEGKTVSLKYLPYPDQPTALVVPSGGMVGVVYSYLTKDTGLWWQVYRDNTLYYVLHEKGLFDVDALHDQGALTEVEIQQKLEDANKTMADKLFDLLSGSTAKILTFAGIGYGTYWLIKLYMENQKQLKP